jgi:hypothetical protein
MMFADGQLRRPIDRTWQANAGAADMLETFGMRLNRGARFGKAAAASADASSEGCQFVFAELFVRKWPGNCDKPGPRDFRCSGIATASGIPTKT